MPRMKIIILTLNCLTMRIYISLHKYNAEAGYLTPRSKRRNKVKKRRSDQTLIDNHWLAFSFIFWHSLYIILSKIRSSTHNKLRKESQEHLLASCLYRDRTSKCLLLRGFLDQLHLSRMLEPISPQNSLSLDYPCRMDRIPTSYSCNKGKG